MSDWRGLPKHQNCYAWNHNPGVKINETGGKFRPYSEMTGACTRCEEQIEGKHRYRSVVVRSVRGGPPDIAEGRDSAAIAVTELGQELLPEGGIRCESSPACRTSLSNPCERAETINARKSNLPGSNTLERRKKICSRRGISGGAENRDLSAKHAGDNFDDC